MSDRLHAPPKRWEKVRLYRCPEHGFLQEVDPRPHDPGFVCRVIVGYDDLCARVVDGPFPALVQTALIDHRTRQGDR